MKKLLIFIFVLLLPTCPYISHAEVDGDFYGKIASENVYLFSSPNASSTLFKLPYSYFVKINDIRDDYYQVTYKDLTGYVLKSNVRLMEGTPSSPYLNLSFSIFTSYSLYEQANTNSNVLCELSENQTLTYYGATSGELASDKSDIWYYASVNNNGNIYHGYIYSVVANSLPNIAINNEEFKEVDESALSSSTPEFSSLSTGTKVLLIIAILIPSAFILYFLIKPNKLSKKVNTEKKIRKVHHGDYFEFDDSDL